MPFIVHWPAKISPGEVDDESVVCVVDILPSLCTITGAELPDGFEGSGEDMSYALLGTDMQQRKKT